MADTVPNYERYCPIFVDAKPQESIEPFRDETICLVGLIPDGEKGVARLRPFKSTRKKRKLRHAKRIVELLEAGELRLHLFAVVGKSSGHFVQWGCETINRARPHIGATWEVEGTTPLRLRWNGYTFSRGNVLGLSVYACMLPLLALRAAALLKKQQVKHVKHVRLLLDRLPHNAAEGAQLLSALPHDPDIRKMWESNRDLGFSFEYGVLDSYRDADGNRVEGKNHPNSILVDWFAAACMAHVNPSQIKDESGYTDSEVEAFAALWRTAEQLGAALVVDVDDEEHGRKVLEHEAKRRGEDHFRPS